MGMSRVVSLHPMMGEELNATEVDEFGLLGDRAYAIVGSSDGKVASAKNPRKWPDLFNFQATFAESPRALRGPAFPTQYGGADCGRRTGFRRGWLDWKGGRSWGHRSPENHRFLPSLRDDNAPPS